jgi:hypothetical protein
MLPDKGKESFPETASLPVSFGLFPRRWYDDKWLKSTANSPKTLKEKGTVARALG